MKRSFSNLNLRLPHEAEVYLPANPKKVYLLLHGYMQDGSYLYKHLIDRLPKDCAVIAPNGPFIVPYKKKDSFEAKFAWYFFDPAKKTYYINFEPAAEFIKSLFIELDLHRKPITLVGYSQGGYLAPKVAELIPAIDTVIGLACCFRNSRFDFKGNAIMHQIHSKSDLVVDYKNAKDEFEELRSRGNLGRFVSLEDEGHKLNSIYIDELLKMI